MAKAKRAALYVRVSTDHQTVENQTSELREVAGRRVCQDSAFGTLKLRSACILMPTGQQPKAHSSIARLEIHGQALATCTSRCCIVLRLVGRRIAHAIADAN